MAVALEAFTVIIRVETLHRIGGLDGFRALVPNQTFCHDDHLARCAFMDRSDAIEFIDSLYLRGLETANPPNPDAVLVTAFDGTMTPECEWLQVHEYKKGMIGWLNGTEPTSISAPHNWNPESEPQLEQMSHEEAARRLRFVRREENVEVFFDSETGRELFVGRTGLPLDQMFEESRQFVLDNMRNPGTPVSVEKETEFRRVIQMLQILSERRAESWTVHWLLGKSWHAIGDSERAFSALKRAFEIEPENTAAARELAGISLELGKSEQAVVAAQAAVTQSPEDAELVSNLAIAYLLDARFDEAAKTIRASEKIDPTDSVTQMISQLIDDVAAGKRTPPQTLDDLNRSAADNSTSTAKKRKFSLVRWIQRKLKLRDKSS